MKMGHRLIKEDVHHYVYEEEIHPRILARSTCLVIDTDRAIVEVTQKFGVGAALLGRWAKQEHQRTGQLPTGKSFTEYLRADERAELAQLRKENAELKMDNEDLGKAAAVFASNPLYQSRMGRICEYSRLEEPVMVRLRTTCP